MLTTVTRFFADVVGTWLSVTQGNKKRHTSYSVCKCLKRSKLVYLFGHLMRIWQIFTTSVFISREFAVLECIKIFTLQVICKQFENKLNYFEYLVWLKWKNLSIRGCSVKKTKTILGPIWIASHVGTVICLCVCLFFHSFVSSLMYFHAYWHKILSGLMASHALIYVSILNTPPDLKNQD